jgi:hypothetical protein
MSEYTTLIVSPYPTAYPAPVAGVLDHRALPKRGLQRYVYGYGYKIMARVMELPIWDDGATKEKHEDFWELIG